MQLKISDEAAAWYQSEMELTEGSSIRFFVRYGGCSTVQKGFSLGVSREEAEAEIGVQTNKKGITFYILEKDLWYFDGHDLVVEYNDTFGEPEFSYN
ncbi:HesB/YadR/YfhF family protein [Mesobacillus foraminis]|uniref:Uncharacterized protein YneR n=1 Tax=Mesobacillus foraminis TaxID=279826 RepID=A0A4R2BHD7_9BACI|nr:HesB/YadR/YfhF family protein [Mesobacillus foraminis]TCN25965.1 uncharacterized protein YneR [Mesobacillus foraminis]